MDHWVWVVPLVATCRGIVYPIQNNQGYASKHHHYAAYEKQQSLEEEEKTHRYNITNCFKWSNL